MHDSIEKLDQGTSKGNEAMRMLEEAERADPNKFPYDFAIENILSFQNTIIDVKMKEKVSHVLEGLTKSIFDALEENRKTLDYIESANIINDSLNRYRKVARGGIPDNIPVINVTAGLDDSIDADRISMAKLVVLAGLEPSNGAARKLIQNRGLKLNGETYTDPQGQLTRAELAAEGGAVIQKGKDKFARLVLES
ncbi:hypothetical protein ACI3L1_11580 [Deinococcus sp. SM5_A1]|uniref:hypothetical protein n=1 Tax=Deinococcus sp. SM5_A1 TaxID=3379094 RepID=UPI00385CFCB3